MAIATPQQEWDLYQADPRAVFTNITSGIRKTSLSCQYFISNLPKICSYWVNGDPGHCSYGEEEEQADIPSGYGVGTCDYLGRRNWCDKYSGAVSEEEQEEEWVCCAPDPFRTGLTKLKNPLPEAKDVTLRPVLKSEIKGYCEEGGVGKCDAQGCGRGCSAPENLTELVKLPIVCSYYKPWSMGFGAIEPQSYSTALKEYGAVYEDAYEQFVKNRLTGTRLPLSFEVYNRRAAFQKCMWWLGAPGVFTYKTQGEANDVITLSAWPGQQCTCTNDGVNLYTNPPADGYGTETQWLLREVWASGNTILCNGAKPECPFYTGSWEYCLDNKMYPGMKITAYQILELRFWTYPWQSQEQYERFFESRPNWNDPTTADIYTFLRWEKNTNGYDGVLVGKKFKLTIDDYYNNIACELLSRDFDVEELIEETEVQFAGYDITGTTTEDQVSFPTLVRSLWDFNFNQLLVIYPYISDKMAPCTFVSNLLNHCFISSVGYTVDKAKVYFINSGFIEVKHPYLNSSSPWYNSVLDIPKDKLEDFIKETKQYLTTCVSKYSSYTVTTSADVFGVYIARLLKIEYNQANYLYIIVECPDGSYLFEKRQVLPQLAGGLINQSSFTWEASGDVTLPTSFSPPPTAEFVVTKLGLSDHFSIYPVSSHRSEFVPSMYSYVLDKINVNGFVCNTWSIIGSTNYIWVEISDVNLNYILRWGFLSGTIKVVTKSDESFTLDLEEIFPTFEDIELKPDGAEQINTGDFSENSASILRISIPPNTLILRPSSDQDSFERGLADAKTLTITIDYWYLKFVSYQSSSTAMINPIYPFPLDSVTLFKPRFTLEANESLYRVSGARSETVALMAIFYTEDGRAVSAVATKLYANAQELYCRSVEIYYKYKSIGQAYELMPTLGSFANREGPERRSIGTNVHTEVPPCGDHECGIPCIGPEWFPFTGCSESNRYNFSTGPGNCIMPYNGEGSDKYQWIGGWVFRPDYRYCITQKYEAWSGLAMPIQNCRVPWQLFYSEKSGEDTFSGYAHIVSWVSSKDYLENGWEFPPFGNYERDFTYRYMTVDRSEYIWVNPYTQEKKPKWAWMPSVLDNNSFYFSFNCFDTPSSTDADDCFSYINQMNFLLCDTISEMMAMETKVDPNTGEVVIVDRLRLRWSDIFKVEGLGNSYYPKPIVYMGGTSYTYHYGFLNRTHAWAWVENWRDIIRNYKPKKEGEEAQDQVESASVQLAFLKLQKPGYRYDDMKYQHRFICEEGLYKIVYQGPEYEEGIVTKLPSLMLASEKDGGWHPRFFELLYKTTTKYDLTPIEWADEGGGSAGGSTDGSIYEATSTGDWINYDNMLFASTEASDQPDDDRTFFTAGMFDWEKSYYNRGLIANMTKSDLLKLPVDETELTYTIIQQDTIEETEETLSESLFVTKSSHYFLKVSFGGSEGEGGDTGGGESASYCINRIVIKGVWGLYTTEEVGSSDMFFSKPGLVVSCTTITGKKITFSKLLAISPLSMISSSPERASLVEYIIEYNIPITPLYVIVDRAVSLDLNFDAIVLEGIQVKEILLFGVEYSPWYEESIYVFEQKFLVSTQDTSSSTLENHLDNELHAREGFGPAGPDNLFSDVSVTSVNKLRSYGSSEKYDYEMIGYGKKLTISTTMDNLYEVEYDVQEKIYRSTCERDLLGDIIKYHFITPPIMKFVNNPAAIDPLVPIPFLCTSKRMTWETLGLAKKYIRYAFWCPGGHYWKWSDNYYVTNCYVYGVKLENIYTQMLVCVLHSGGTSPIITPEYHFFNNVRPYQKLAAMFTGL